MEIFNEFQFLDRNARIFKIGELFRVDIFDAQDDYQSTLTCQDEAIAGRIAQNWTKYGDRAGFEREAGRY